MPSPLPVIRGASAALYPFTMTISFLTEISQWQNGKQKRSIGSTGLVKVAIPYGGLAQAQKNTVKGAFTSAKGRFDNTLSISLPFAGGMTTFSNFGLDSDELIATESSTMVYSAPLKLTQSITQSLSPGTPGQPFPTLANGAIGVLPYLQKKRFQTVAQKVAAGTTSTYAEFGGGLAGYPPDGLLAWEFSGSSLTDTDSAALVGHFVANYGRAYSFTFTDEDGSPYGKTHYASDDLVVTYSGPNDSSVRIALEETN